MRLAVIGIGRMGRALVSRLLVGGQEVVVWNRTPGKASELVSKGAWEAPSPEEAARCDVVLLALADDAAALSMLDTLVGSAGFVVNTSTVSLETTDRLAAALGLSSDTGFGCFCLFPRLDRVVWVLTPLPGCAAPSQSSTATTSPSLTS
jgi:3-hydroxyisobutyrate dehydrogenase-like beta-hydroxyacid dehydrogenase